MINTLFLVIIAWQLNRIALIEHDLCTNSKYLWITLTFCLVYILCVYYVCYSQISPSLLSWFRFDCMLSIHSGLIVLRKKEILSCFINMKPNKKNLQKSEDFQDSCRQIQTYKSNSEYLVRNPVQGALRSNKRQKAKYFFEYFWLRMTLRPEGSRNLF